MILRDPPGDNSHAFMDATHTTCYGQSISALNVMEGSVWASAKVGSAGSAGFLVETDYEASVELSGGLTMGSTQTSETTNEVCITTTNGYETGSAGQVGTDGDVFIGSALEYAYGKYVTLSVNNDCANPISLEEELVFALTGNAEQEFIYTEYTILGLIGQLTADLLLLDPASDEYKFTEDQLEVWEQAIALNNELKAEATTAETTTFSGGTTANYAHTGTSTTTKSIEMDVYLDVNFAIEMNLSAGGSGVSAGASARIRQETGTGSSSSSSTATTVGYTLSDDDTDDIFTVNRKTDPVFGTAIFELVEESSATSCPYAGGYQIDQPQIFFQDGTSTTTLNDVPTGTEPTFEIQLCNPSDYGRYYNIKVNPNTNPAGAVLEGFGENLSATDEGFSIYLQPGECLENVVITFTQSSTSILDYEGIELYLYAACQPASAPLLSSIFLDVHFSDGTGVHDLDVAPAQLGVFPNPTSGAAQITLDAVQAQSQLTLTDATGRVYHTWSVPAGQSVQTLNGEALGAGMYLLTLENAHQRSVKRVIIR